MDLIHGSVVPLLIFIYISLSTHSHCAPWHAHASLPNQKPEGIFSYMFSDLHLSIYYKFLYIVPPWHSHACPFYISVYFCLSISLHTSFWGHSDMSDYVCGIIRMNSFLSICQHCPLPNESLLSTYCPFWAQLWASYCYCCMHPILS